MKPTTHARRLDPLEEAIAFAIREASRLKHEQQDPRGKMRDVAGRKGKAA